MHHTNTSTLRSVVSESQTLLRNILARYGTFSTHIQTAYQRTVPVPSQQGRTVLFTKTEAYLTVLPSPWPQLKLTNYFFSNFYLKPKKCKNFNRILLDR